MNEQSSTQDFQRELQSFFAKNSQEFLRILRLIPDLNTRSYPIYLGRELMKIVGDFLEKHASQSLEPETSRTEKVAPKLFPVSGDRSSGKEKDNKIKQSQNTENLWQYREISPDRPENHLESYCQKISVEDGYNIIGASVRGKSHKHKGTNRDDWFEFASSGKWQIIAVADGAGSKVFSRLGAKISCKTAVEKLAQSLAEHQLKPRRDRQELRQTDEDIDLVYQSIAEAISAAHQAVTNKAEQLEDSVTYYKAIGDRRLKLSDLAATLLIAIRTTIEVGNKEYSFVFSHQIGDGIIAAISQQDNLDLLGIPDSGNYAGQTKFLTSTNKHDVNFIRGNIKTFLGQLKTLMIMSDGVSDDYFPSSPQILSLYGDLVLNQILPWAEIEQQKSELTSEQETAILNTETDIQKKYADFCCQHQVLTAKGINNFPVAYLDKYARLLGMSELELIASPLLPMGAKVNPVGEIYQSPENLCPAERLRNWLDAYYRRGSFDDRTLVILHQQ